MPCLWKSKRTSYITQLIFQLLPQINCIYYHFKIVIKWNLNILKKFTLIALAPMPDGQIGQLGLVWLQNLENDFCQILWNFGKTDSDLATRCSPSFQLFMENLLSTAERNVFQKTEKVIENHHITLLIFQILTRISCFP